MIQVNRIYIKNFKRFREVEIKPEAKPGLFVFIGKNYLGKSNFLNAICWCLYEETPFKQSIEEDSSPNDDILNVDTAKENEFAKVVVEMHVSDSTNEYRFVRSIVKTQDSKFDVYRLSGKDWKLVPNPEIIREMLLPKSLRKYFIFAGENLERLYSPGFEKELREGVRNVSDIIVLDKAIDHLGSVLTDARREAGRDNPEIDYLNTSKEQCDLVIKDAEKKLEEINDEVNKLKKIRIEYKEEQKKYDKDKTLFERRDAIDEEIEKIETKENEIRNKINYLLTEKTPFVYLRKVLEELYSNISNEEKTGKLPPDIQVDFIKELINNGICICGRKIIKADKSADILNKLLSEYEPASQRISLLEDKYIISSILRGQGELKNDLLNLIGERGEMVAKKNDLDREKKEIGEKLKNSNFAKVSNIEIALEDLDNKIDNYLVKIGRLEEQINQDKIRAKDLVNQIKKAEVVTEKNKKIIQTKDFLEISYKSLNYVRERITDRVRRVLSNDTEKYFRELFWDQEQFETIEFTEDYGLIVKEKGINRPKTEFAMGEGKVLGLATMRAIAEISGFSEVPIFFDAPLSNLGAEIRHNFLKIMPDLAPNKQVFIFSLDDNEMLDFIKGMSKNRVYKLKKDPKNDHSTVIEEYYAK